MSRFSPRALVYLAIALIIFIVAVVLGSTRAIGPGWAAVALTVVYVVMVGQDARARGLSVLWGLWALTLIGAWMYVRAVRRQGPSLRP